MEISTKHKREAIMIAVLLAALLVVAGCSEIKPYYPPNHREEGPLKGLFTGSEGEWVILGPKPAPTGEARNKDGQPQSETGPEQKKNPAKSSDSDQ